MRRKSILGPISVFLTVILLMVGPSLAMPQPNKIISIQNLASPNSSNIQSDMTERTVDVSGLESSLNQLQEDLRELAREAGRIMQFHRDEAFAGGETKVKDQVARDLQTAADREVHALLLEELPKLFFKHFGEQSLVISEEDFGPDKDAEAIIESAMTTEYVWVVDPLDGTANYVELEGREFGVGISLLKNGVPILGLFYAPELQIGESKKGMLFDAVATKEGAFLNGDAISFTQETDFENQVAFMVKSKSVTEGGDFEDLLERRLANVGTGMLGKAFPGLFLISVMAARLPYTELQRPFWLFTHKRPKIYDIIPSGFILTKLGGTVMFQDGSSIFPIDFSRVLSVVRDSSKKQPRFDGNIFATVAPKQMVLNLIQEDLHLIILKAS